MAKERTLTITVISDPKSISGGRYEIRIAKGNRQVANIEGIDTVIIETNETDKFYSEE